MAARYFLFCILFIVSCVGAGQSPYYALKGGTVSLKPVIAGHPDGILWKYNGNKVVEFNGREEAVYSPYENRITLGWQTADLNISDLRFEDSGEYELDADINKRLHRSVYTLEVIEKVAKPTITCEMRDEGRSNTSGKLLCSPEQPQPSVKFEWRAHGNVQPGPQLQISLGDKHDDEVYSCTVSNRVSQETATFTAKDCYPEESSSALLIALLVTGALLLLVGLAILYCKLRHKACFAKDVEKRSPPGRTEDTVKAQDDERMALVHRAPTLLSTQRLHHLVQGNGNMRPDEPAGNQREDADSEHEPVKVKRKKTALLPPKGVSYPPDLNNLASDDKGDADAEQHREPSEEKEPQSDPSDSEKDNEPEPAVVSDDFSEDTQSSPKSPVSPGHPVKRKKTALLPPKGVSYPLDLSNLASDDKGDADAEQHREPSEEKEPQSDPSDSEKDNEPEPAVVSDDFSEDTQSSPKSPVSPGHPEPEKEEDEDEEAHSAPAGAETSPAARPHCSEVDNSVQVTGESAERNVREDEEESKTESAGDHEETDGEKDLHSTTSQQPRSPTPTKPNRSTGTCQESPATAHAHPEEEEEEEEEHKTGTDSDETEGRSDKEEQGNESCGGDSAGQKKDEDVA
ncbi:hypothetical protein VZT92_005302 [Zoarces viviparus]|uniref:Ig-like domain-containing protein n=1 Tax=Zoarces viviparus TaxID=48416 RepID=A0AAW1FVH9_ZOAVI